MGGQRDTLEIAQLQARALSYASADRRRAASMLLSAARGVLGHDMWRSLLWDDVKRARKKPDEVSR
jgi:hypothetical protein